MNRELDLMDILSIASFLIAVQNLDLNVSGDDMHRQTNELTERLEKAINDIHEHLTVQDAKLNIILNRLEDVYGG